MFYKHDVSRLFVAEAKTQGGTCILCGLEKSGAMAKADAVIGAARKLREALKMPSRRTVACSKCIGECIARRAEFEKRLGKYRVGAAVFFLVLAVGQIAYRSFSLQAVLAAALGAAIIALLPYVKYFPKFESRA